MARVPAVTAGEPEQQPEVPEVGPPVKWLYIGVERVWPFPATVLHPDDVLEAVEPLGDPAWWVRADKDAAVTTTAGGVFLYWTPEELQRGALREDWPVEEGK